MRIYTYPLSELQANCYLIEEEGKGILIDPADDASFLLEEIQRKGLELVALLATHGHFDHIMAVGEIQMSFNVPLYIHKKDQFLISRLESTAEHFLGHKPVIVEPTLVEYLTPGNFQISNFKFQIVASPGHTPGSVSYYFPDEKIVFTGDTLFAGAIGSTDLSYSNKKDLWSSLKALLALPEETAVYPGHGDSTYISDETFLLH